MLSESEDGLKITNDKHSGQVPAVDNITDPPDLGYCKYELEFGGEHNARKRI